MQTDFISNLPDDVSKILFTNHLDNKSQLACLQLNNKINNLISTKKLFDIGIFYPQSDSSAYSQLVSYYKEKKYCEFFLNRIPYLKSMINDLNLDTSDKVKEVKNNIDKQLSLPYKEDPDWTLLDEAWTHYLLIIGGYVGYTHDNKFNYNESQDNNKEVQIFLSRGAHKARSIPNVFGNIIKNKWCSKETMQMLLDKKFDVNGKTINAAIQNGNFKEFLPLLFKQADTISLSDLFEGMTYVNTELLLKYTDKITEVTASDIHYALHRLHSEKLISKLWNKNFEDRQICQICISIALEEKYSENFVLELLKTCPNKLKENSIIAAIENLYSKKIIEELLAKLGPEVGIDNLEIYFWVNKAFSKCQDFYDADFKTHVINKIINNRDEQIGKQFLPSFENVKEVSSYVIYEALEEKNIPEYAVSILLKKCPKVDFYLVELAFCKNYSPNFIREIVSKCSEGIRPICMYYALRSNSVSNNLYSQEVIEELLAKINPKFTDEKSINNLKKAIDIGTEYHKFDAGLIELIKNKFKI